MSTTRHTMPVLIHGAVAIAAATFGIFYAVLCLHTVFAIRGMAWGYFLVAELFLLIAWGFWRITRIRLAIERGILKKEQVRRKPGLTVRLSCLFAAMIVPFIYIAVGIIFTPTPWWLRHVCGVLIATLLVFGLTYPWSSTQSHMPPNTALEPTPTAPPVLSKP